MFFILYNCKIIQAKTHYYSYNKKLHSTLYYNIPNKMEFKALNVAQINSSFYLRDVNTNLDYFYMFFLILTIYFIRLLNSFCDIYTIQEITVIDTHITTE